MKNLAMRDSMTDKELRDKLSKINRMLVENEKFKMI